MSHSNDDHAHAHAAHPQPPMPPPRRASATPLILREGFGTGTILTSAQIALGVAATLCFLTAAFRRRGEIATAANSAYNSYQASAPARAEAGQRTREGLARAVTATAAAAGTDTATAVGNYHAYRAQRDVTAPVGNSDGIYEYPETAGQRIPTNHADTAPNTPSEFAGGSPDDTSWGLSDPSPDGTDGWNF